MPAKKKLENSMGVEIEEINYSFAEHLGKITQKFHDTFTLLLLVDSAEYNEIISGIMEKLVAKDKMQGAYLTANKQSRMLLDFFSREVESFNPSKIYFLDCASKETLQKKGENSMSCSPQNLIDLNIAINQALEVIPAGGFFIMDSISALAIYNDEKVLKKFIKTVVEKCYLKKVNGFFLCSNTKSMADFIEDISPFFDETINAQKS